MSKIDKLHYIITKDVLSLSPEKLQEDIFSKYSEYRKSKRCGVGRYSSFQSWKESEPTQFRHSIFLYMKSLGKGFRLQNRDKNALVDYFIELTSHKLDTVKQSCSTPTLKLGFNGTQLTDIATTLIPKPSNNPIYIGRKPMATSKLLKLLQEVNEEVDTLIQNEEESEKLLVEILGKLKGETHTTPKQ